MILLPYAIPPLTWYIKGIQVGNFKVGNSVNKESLKKTKGYAINAPNKSQILQFPTFEYSQEINDLTINYSVKWISEHKNALQAAYGNSPFFEFYNYKIYTHFENKYNTMSELRFHLLTQLHKILNLEKFELKFIYEVPEDQTSDFTLKIPEYPQVFEDKFGFRPEVSILDLIFNLGPMSKDYLFKFSSI